MLLHMGNQLADRAHKVWGVYKNIAAGRGLLQWIGLWPGAVAAIIAVGTWLSARIVHLARPEQFVLALFVFVLVLAAVVLFKIGRVAAERRVLGRIEFNYLPANPVDNGWTRAYKDDATVSFGADLDIDGSLRLEVQQSEFAMDYPVPAQATLADRLTYTAKCNNSSDLHIATMIFARVKVSPRDRRASKELWLKFYHGHKCGKPTPGKQWFNPETELPEQTVWWPATPLSNGTMKFDIDLHEAVRLALGEQGWIYSSAVKVRLRGNLSISPIEFWANRAA